MPYCRNCGGEVGAGDRFCQHCGAQLGGDSGQRRGDRDADSRDADSPHDHGTGEHRQGQGQEQGQLTRDGYDDRAGSGQDRAGSRSGPDGHARGGRGTDAGRGGHSQEQPRGPPGRPGHVSHGDAGPPQDRKESVDFALTYPVADSWGPVLVSGVLLITGFLIVPFLALVGYSYRVARAAALGHEKPPGYGNWGGLVVDGLRLSAVGLVLGVGFLVVGVVVFALVEQNPLFGLLAVPLYLGAVYVPPAFVTAFIGTDSVTDTFTSGRASALLGNGYYAKAVLFWILLQIVLGFAVGLLVLTIVGWIWGYAFGFLAQSAFWGYVHYRAAGQGIVPPAEGTLGRGAAPQRGDAGVGSHP